MTGRIRTLLMESGPGFRQCAAAATQLERNQRLVYTPSADGTKLKPVVVKTGITDGVDTEILEGLTEARSRS